MDTPSLESIASLAKRRGFIFQGSDVYGGLAGTWDYGPLGVELKKNIIDLWWRMFVYERDDIYGVDSAILMNPRVWQASGHVDTFTDPLVECQNCKGRFRQDTLRNKTCPTCNQDGTFSEPRMFNLMFTTNIGPIENEDSITYLRPETAQGIFSNYKNVIDTSYPDMPFGIAQVGKAFRNEISPRDFVFRTREFEQMEIEYFIRGEEWQKHFENWREYVWIFFEQLGLNKSNVHEYEVPEADLAHYSKRTIDFEFDFPHGRDELMGLAYRTDFDLQNVQRESGKSMQYRPKDGADPFVPHVIEPSFGVERAVMAVLVSAYREQEIEGDKRIYLQLPEHLAPVKMAVFPLLKNRSELIEKARLVYQQLKQKYGRVIWDDNGNIGKRYRRQDEIGTPICITIDFETLENNTITVRDRDTMQQSRVQIGQLSEL